ncbi:PepSY domain-containing protein [Methanobacterium sp.]|uniref:PepSY domain-containing protein n=1 Tax=Methanobacterium sp. TaxID=2164 RepID=UPI003C74A64D
MIKKAIVAIVVIVAAAAIVFAAAGNHTNSVNSANQENQQNLSTSNGVSDNSSSNTSTSDDSQKKISSAEAKKIAQKYIEEKGATAGTPTLSKIDGKYVYTVPVIKNGKNVGEIDIDALTGKNVGGAGGAP